MSRVYAEAPPIYDQASTNHTKGQQQEEQESLEITILPERSASGRDSGRTSMTNTEEQAYSEETSHDAPQTQDDWLPITESRNGNAFTSAFHLLSSGIGIQTLALPLALAALGWFWGILCMSLAFLWQLYTIWVLVHLHESVPGTRFSRYLHLSIAAFGPKLGKLLSLFPVMYLSGGTCVMMIINGGGTMELFYQVLRGDQPKMLSGAEWFLVFTCLAVLVAQFHPNLNSIIGVSMIGAITAFGYCGLIWILSICKGRPDGVAYDPSKVATSEAAKIRGILNAFGIIALAFRGHNVVLEIQGTLPTSPKHPSRGPMWRGVTVSYLLIAMCLFPLAIGGYWAYGNKLAARGLLSSFTKFHGHDISKHVMGIIYLLIVINCLSTYQIFAMPVFDNLERIYTSRNNRRCPRWLRSVIRLFFGGLTFFIAVAFPFLGSLAPLIGGITLPLAFSYPCFMRIAIEKPPRNSKMWCLNLGLGCSGVLLSVLLVAAAVWTLACNGIDANFFNPR